MSTVIAPPTSTPSRTLDVSGTERVPMTTLVGVELRKTFDTRAGLWFSISVVGLMVAVAALSAAAFPESQQTFIANLGVTGGIVTYFLPILVILLVTSEWSQRTGLTTFALEPRRPRVVAAKLLTGLVLVVAALVLAAAAAAAATAASTINGGSAQWDVARGPLQSFLLAGVLAMLIGFALATLLRNSPAAIVTYFLYTFLLPTVVGALSFFLSWFEPIAPWVEFNTAQVPLISGDYQPTGEQWAQIAVSGTIWLLLPLALGVWRLVRAEVK